MNEKTYTLPSLELGEETLSCPKCGWAYKKYEGPVLASVYVHEVFEENKIAMVFCDGCGCKYATKVTDNKVYNF